jgi:hypothetical protein
MEWMLDFLGILLAIAGGFLGLKQRTRKFDRTNQFGIEQFSSFSGKLVSKLKDGLLALLSIFLLTFGVMILAFHYQNSWGWLAILPAYAFICGVWLPKMRKN